jgi:N-acyl-phosphatidylethanolamine-hydrolysing phospholipase D
MLRSPPSCHVITHAQPDFVVISHSHYDHLCARSVEALRAHFSGASASAKASSASSSSSSSSSEPLHWYVPLGLADWFRAAGVAHVTELDWWQEANHKGVRVVPMRARVMHCTASR